MKASALSATVLAMAVLASPTAAAPVYEYWVGTYNIQSDVLTALLRIEYSPSRCESGGCMWILVQGPGQVGEAALEHIDPDGMHLILRLPSGARADCYLVRGTPAIAGTLEWPGNRRGFLALKQGVSLSGGRGSGSPRGGNPDQVRAATRGAVSGPPVPSRGHVLEETEKSGSQANAQPVSLPDPPPGTDQDLWLKNLNDNLFDGIVRLLRNDTTLVEIFLQEEGMTPKSEYSRAYYRADFVRRWLNQ